MQDLAKENTGGLANETNGMNYGLSLKGIMLGVPIEASIIHCNNENILSGRLTISAQPLIGLLNMVHEGAGSVFSDTPLYSLAEKLHGSAALVWNSSGTLILAVNTDTVSAGVLHKDSGTFVIFAVNAGTTNALTGEGQFDAFVSGLRSEVGAFSFRFAFKSGSGLRLSDGADLLRKLEEAAFDCKEDTFKLSNCEDINDASVLVLADVDLKQGDMGFFNILSEVLSAGITVSLAAAYSESNSFIKLRIQPSGDPQDGGLMIRSLECSFYFTKNPMISLKGELLFYINQSQYNFLIDSSASADSFSICAEYTGIENPISLGDYFSLYQLGISIGYKDGGLLLGGWGNLKLGRLDLFALIFMRSVGSALSLTALGLALNRMDLSMLLSVFGIELPGADDFDFLVIEPLPLKADKMNMQHLSNFPNSSLNDIAEDFSHACDGSCGGGAAAPVTGDKLLVRKNGNCWLLTDENNVRHYSVSSDGDILLTPQLYYCTEDNIAAGSYSLYKGLFVCSSISLLGIKINIFFQVRDNVGLEGLVNIAPIDMGWLVLERPSEKCTLRGERSIIRKENDLLEQYLYSGDGPVLYLCIKENDYIFYLFASVKLLDIISLDAYIVFDTDKFLLDAKIDFIGFSARIILSADFADFARKKFNFSVTFDLSGFQDILDKAVQKVKDFVSNAQQALSSAQEKLDYAQQQVLGLRSQIDAVNAKIDEYTTELRWLKWWQFYKAPYYLFQIGCCELEKAGIYVALGVAYAALEIAKQVLELLKQTVSVVGKIIEKLAEAISSLFCLKSVTLSLGSETKLAVCFTLFGKDYNISTGLEKGIESFHDTASEVVCSETDKQLNKMCSAKETLLLARSSLGAYLAESDFPYNDCAGYKQCIGDGLDYAKNVAAATGRMEAAYIRDFGCTDPMTDIHSGQIYQKLSQTKSQWQCVFSAVQNIDCGELLDEARKQAAENSLTEGADSILDELDSKWSSMKDLQRYLKERSGDISGLDTDYLKRKQQVCSSLIPDKVQEPPDPDQAGDSYCTDIFRMYSKSSGDEADAPGFVPGDTENYFINPANEPILDYLFEKLCRNSSYREMQGIAAEVHEDGERKRTAVNYRIRVK